MWSHRLLYLLTLALSALFYVLYPLWFGWYLLIFLLLIAPFDIFISLPGMLTRHLSLSSPYQMEQSGDGALVVTVQSKMPLPSGPVKVRLRVIHEDRTVSRRLVCSGARGSRAALKIDSSRTGITSYELRRIRISSLLGLFTLPMPLGQSARIRVHTLILPEPARPPRALSMPRVLTLRPKPGGGFSEEHDIRPYRRGDPVNSVHWKLSAKHDSLMIREALEPPPHSRLVRITLWSGPDERDMILARLCWVSAWLLGRGLTFCARLGERGEISEISSPEELSAFLHGSLGGALTVSHTQMPARFTWVFVVDAREVSE